MKIVELNRIIESFSQKSHRPEEIADFLEFVATNNGTKDDSNESELCRENMQTLFPDPVVRAKMFKRLALSACLEEPEGDDENAIAKEAGFFMNEMLESIVQAFNASNSLTKCKMMIEKILEDG